MKSTSSHFPRRLEKSMLAPDWVCRTTGGTSTGCRYTAIRRAVSVVNAWKPRDAAPSAPHPASSTARLASRVRRMATARRAQQSEGDLHAEHQHRRDQHGGADHPDLVIGQPLRQVLRKAPRGAA